MCPYFYFCNGNNNYMMRGPMGPGPMAPMPPFMPGNFGGPASGPPSSPPPSTEPKKPTTSAGPGVKAIDPGSIRFCRYRLTYIWPSRGRGFWMWIVYVGRRSISGWRWTGRNWVYSGIDLNRIDSFTCY